MSASRLAAVACDLGGVIVDAPFDAFTALERESGATVGAVRKINSSNPHDNAWARIERGEITVDEFVALFTAEASAAGHPVPGRDVIDVVRNLAAGPANANKAMVGALRTCKEYGLRLALTTNNIAPLADGADAGWLFDLFDVVVESCVVGKRKPEPEIYRFALRALQVTPNETVMLDDLGINLKTARELGMETIKVADPGVAARQLTDLIGDRGRSLE